MQKAQVDSGRRYNGDHNKSISRFIVHPKLNNPIPRTEQSLDLKFARKVTKRSKRDLRGLWETLAPGSTVVRTSDTTTVIKEPGVPEVCVRNSDIAKLGTRAERKTFGSMQNDVLSPMRKPRRKRFRSTPKSSKRNSVGKSKFVTAQTNQTRPRESRLQIAISERRWHPENLKSHKQEANVPEILLQPSTHQMLLLLLRTQ